MDIFTTQLTRVMPNRIIPQKLKVKALVKEGRTTPLSDKLKELEQEDYIELSDNDQKQSQQQANEQQASDKKTNSNNDEASQQSKQSSDEKTPPHLDLFV